MCPRGYHAFVVVSALGTVNMSDDRDALSVGRKTSHSDTPIISPYFMRWYNAGYGNVKTIGGMGCDSR